MTIYISNISYKASKEDLDELFAPFGEIKNRTIPKDHAKNRMRGYAFIELEDLNREAEAIAALNNTQHMGRNIRVEKSNYEKSPYFG